MIVRCSVAQWRLRTIVIAEKSALHLPDSGSAASSENRLCMNISFFSSWFLQGCTNRRESRALLKKSDGAATAQRVICEIHRCHGGISLRVKVAMDTHGMGGACDILSQFQLCVCFGCWQQTHAIFGSSVLLILINTGRFKVWSSCLPLAADTYSSTSIIFFVIVIIIFPFITLR